jgi:amylosucrase
MAAALCGITAALGDGDVEALRLGIDRLLLLYALAFGYGGIPMIYMGDELAQGDDESNLGDPLRAGDSRWRHRPLLDPVALAARHDTDTVTGQVFSGIRRLVAARRRCRPLHGAGTVAPVGSGHASVFAWLRTHERFGAVLGLANVSNADARVPYAVFTHLGDLPVVDLLDRPGSDGAGDELDRRVDQRLDQLALLRPFQVRWVTPDAEYRALPTSSSGSAR